MWLLESLKLHMWLALVARIIFLFTSAVLELLAPAKMRPRAGLSLQMKSRGEPGEGKEPSRTEPAGGVVQPQLSLP